MCKLCRLKRISIQSLVIIVRNAGRKDAMQIVADFGGFCENSVTKKTNFLILGEIDYSVVKDGKSSNLKKAEKYKLDGQDIEVISENVFYEMLN